MTSFLSRSILFKRKLFRKFSSNSSAPKVLEKKIKILDENINYVESLGNCENAHPLIFLPGAFGSIEMDFTPILSVCDTNKYKWIAWDPPGYGKSRPPDRRNFHPKNYETANLKDVPYIIEFMKILGHDSYTLLPWSGAAHGGMTVAAEMPEKVSGVISWGAYPFVDKPALKMVAGMRKIGIAGIPQVRRDSLIKMYGADLLVQMWNDWLDEQVRIEKGKMFSVGGTFENTLRNVQCNVLIIHGTNDNIIPEYAARHFAKTCRNGRFELFENGSHALHIGQTQDFLKAVYDFVDSNSKSK